jgi:SHS2 domain-containing protein
VTHGFDDHVGELALWVAAPTERDVFVEALEALAEVLRDDAGAPRAELRHVALDAPDRAVLLADWLAELAFLAETDGFVPEGVEALELRDGTALRARVRGHAGRPPHLVKAVTYHDLRFEPAPEGWRAHVLLDV